MDTPTSSLVNATTRNGQLRSCVPCRKAKTRCDHRLPSCERCERKGRARHCVYDPASSDSQPPNQSAPAHPPKRPKTSNPVSPVSLENQNIATGLIPGDQTLDSPLIVTTFGGGTVGRDAHIAYWGTKKSASSTGGFLGSASSSALFIENASALGVPSFNSLENARQNLSWSSNLDTSSIDPRQVYLGAQLLSLLESLPLYERVVKRWYRASQGLVLGEPIVRCLFESVKEVYLQASTSGASRHQALLDLSTRIFEHGISSIDVGNKDVLSSVLGPNLRWEIIGLVFTMVGLSATSMTDCDPVFSDEGDQISDRNILLVQATTAGDVCLAFCETAGQVGDPLAWLLYEHTLLLTMVYGVADYRAWRRLGDLSSAIFALGFHGNVRDDEKISLFLIEMRKRVMCAAYGLDLQLATFLGRPSRISRQFCNIRLPLDISESTMMGNDDDRNEAISKLDADGWNTEGSLLGTVRLRMSVLLGFIREDLLSLSLRNDFEDITHRIKEVSERSRRTWDRLPTFLHYKPEVWNSERPDQHCFILMIIYLDALYNDFLLQRNLVRHGESATESLISISREILSTILFLDSKRDRLLGYTCDIAQTISIYGLPSAGVLAIELLKCSQQPIPTTDYTFPFAEVVQNLSVFVSCLDKVIDVSEGNYELSKQGRKVISHILDRALAPKASHISTTVRGTPHAEQVFPDPNLGLDMLPDDGFDFVKWLDSMEWSQEPWVIQP